MDAHHLRTLRELRDRGSVTAVAAAVHLSPSAVSQQLAALQRTVPVALTEQRGRVLALTAAGHRVADAAEGVLAALAVAREAATDFLEAPADPVRVTAFHSAALAWFPELLRRAGATPDGPPVHVRDEDVATGDFPGLVADHDVVVAHRPFGSKPWPQARVSVTPLLEEPIDLAVGRSHPLAGRGSVRLDELAGQRWSAAHEGFPLEPLLLDRVAAGTGEPPEVVHRVNEFTVVASIVAATDTVALLPRHTGPGARYAGQVVLLPIEDLHVGRHIDLLTRRDALARRSVRTVVGWLRAVAAGEVVGGSV